MSYLPKLAALVALSASALLGVACATGPADPAPAPAEQAPEALQSRGAPTSPVVSDGDDEATDDAADAEHWNSWEFGPCRRFRRCVRARSFHFCARRMPHAAYHCSHGSYPPGQDWGEGNEWGEGPGDHGPGDHGPGDHGPGDHGPGDHGPGDHGPGDHGPGDHGPGDNGHGDHGPGDHGHGDHDHGDHGPGDHGHGDHDHGDHGHGGH
jgi:hypothetical protein